MPRRGHGEGSVFRAKDGGWRGFVTIGIDAQGRQVKRWFRGKTRKEVATKVWEARSLAGSRLVAKPERVTVAEWLRRYVRHRSSEVRPRTLENYQHYLSKIEPAMGHRLMRSITPFHVQDLYRVLAESGLSPSVRQHVHHFLKRAFADAVSVDVLDRNPVEVVARPLGGRIGRPRVWEAHQVRVFLDHARADRLYAAFYLMLAAGLRIGEVLGLRWSDIDEGSLQIKRTLSLVNNRPTFGPPKTARSQRAVYVGNDVVRVLEDRRHDACMERAVAPRWEDHDLVFATTVGTPISPNNFRRRHRRLVEAAGLPRIRVHDLRHTYITLARDAGVDAEVVAERVGQDVRVTMRVYSQVTEQRKRKAAKPLQELLHDN